MNVFLTVNEAAVKIQRTTQALYTAINAGRIKVDKSSRVWTISENDLEEYMRTRNCRKHSRFNGELKFDMNKGLIDVKTASQITGMSLNSIYYFLYTGRIPYVMKGGSYVLEADFMLKFSKQAGYKKKRRL